MDPIIVQLLLALSKVYLQHKEQMDEQARLELAETLKRLNRELERMPDLSRGGG